MDKFLKYIGLKPRSVRRLAASFTSLVVFGHIIFYAFTSPVNEGPWKPYYERTALVEMLDGAYHIRNFRRARYDAEGVIQSIEWQDRIVDPSKLKSVWLGISVFAEPLLAHTFLSFDFGDGDPLVVSIEARQRPDQSYSPVRGLYDAYHLIYVLADERDIIGVRTHARAETVYFHPLTIEPETQQTLLADMMARTAKVAAEPEFYNTLTGNCTNSLIRDAPYSVIKRYFDPRVLLPGLVDRAAYAEDILDRRYSLESLKRAALIDPAEFSPSQSDLSAHLRSKYRERLSKEERL